jgi:flagellar protein FliT
MTGHEYILDIYGSLSIKSGEMLDAAKSSDWDQLIALEQDCSALIDSLRLADTGACRDTDYMQRKAAIIRKVLADDAEVRKFTEPWMHRLEAFLGSARREYRLQRAYETGQADPA